MGDVRTFFSLVYVFPLLDGPTEILSQRAVQPKTTNPTNPRGYQVMGYAKIVLEINQKDITPKLSKGEKPFLFETRCLNLIYILLLGFVILFQSLITYSRTSMARTPMVRS